MKAPSENNCNSLSGVHVLTAHRYGKHVINWGGKDRKFRPEKPEVSTCVDFRLSKECRVSFN